MGGIDPPSAFHRSRDGETQYPYGWRHEDTTGDNLAAQEDEGKQKRATMIAKKREALSGLTSMPISRKPIRKQKKKFMSDEEDHRAAGTIIVKVTLIVYLWSLLTGN